MVCMVELGCSSEKIMAAGGLSVGVIRMGLDEGCSGVGEKKMESLVFCSLNGRSIDIPLMGMQVFVEMFPFIGKLVVGIFFIHCYDSIYFLSQLRGIFYFKILICSGMMSTSGFADSGAS